MAGAIAGLRARDEFRAPEHCEARHEIRTERRRALASIARHDGEHLGVRGRPAVLLLQGIDSLGEPPRDEAQRLWVLGHQLFERDGSRAAPPRSRAARRESSSAGDPR